MAITITSDDNARAGAPLTQQFVGAMKILGLDNDPRCQGLAFCQAFYDGTQHDHAGSSWDGVPRDPGVGYLRERLKPQGFVPVNSAMISKKPDAPVPLARQITSRFTEMLLGEGRRPSIRCASSKDAEEFLEAAFQESEMWDVLSEARDKAGACGTSAVVVGITNGHLTGEVLHPKNLWVPMWDDETPYWAPRMVVEQRRVRKEVQDKDTGRLGSVDVWKTRAWTEDAVIYYEDVLVSEHNKGEKKEKPIKVDYERPHNLGKCPVVWYQNTRATSLADGTPDCDPTWPLLDKLDRLQSQVYKAAIANTDPTLMIKEAQYKRRRNNIIRKGSDGILAISADGDAKYLEMQGTSVKVGMDAILDLTTEILQTVECVVIQPEHAKAYQSGEALQILWRSMEARANRLRTPLSVVIRQICKIMIRYGLKFGIANSEDEGKQKDGEKAHILLPPRKIVKPVPERPPVPPGEFPEPPPEPEITWEAHTVEKGNKHSHIALEWPNYWTPTPAQIMSTATAMSTATGGKQIISAETSTRYFAGLMSVDPDEETRRLEKEKLEGAHEVLLMGGFGEDEDDGDPGDPGKTPKDEVKEKKKKDDDGPEKTPKDDAKDSGSGEA